MPAPAPEAGIDLARRQAEERGLYAPDPAWWEAVGEGPIPSGDLTIPQAFASADADINLELATRVAEARALWQWGPTARLVSVVPLTDRSGVVMAYDFDFVLDGSVFGGYRETAEAWRKENERIGNRSVDPLSGGVSAASEGAMSTRFGAVTVGTSLDRSPILCTWFGASNFYSAGWIARAVARGALATADPQLNQVMIRGATSRLYEFAAAGRRIVVQGQYPWGWAPVEEFYSRPHGLGPRHLDELEDALAARGQTMADLRDSLRAEHLDALNRWLEPAGPEREDPLYALVASYGCCFTHLEAGEIHTCLSEWTNFYDLAGNYGGLTDFFSQYTFPLLTSCHMPDNFFSWDYYLPSNDPDFYYEALVAYAGDEGYAFSGGIDLYGNITDWHWDEGKAEILSDHPFVYTDVQYWNGEWDPDYYTVVGYDVVPHPDEWVAHIPQGNYRPLVSISHDGGPLDYVYLAGPHPGGADAHNLQLLRAEGDTTWNSCNPGEYLDAGEGYTIRWTNYDNPADHVKIDLSYDGGYSWETLVTDRQDVGWYRWQVEDCLLNYEMRIRITQYDGSEQVQGVDGSFGNFAVRPASCPPPVLLGPAHGSNCVNPVAARLDWSHLGCADSYEVQVGAACGSGTVHQTEDDEITLALDPETVYWWRARSRSECGVGSPWTECSWFSTGELPLPPPGQQSPADGATCQGTSGVLDWSDVPGSWGYQVQLWTQCGGATGLQPTTDSQYAYANLIPGTTYYWRVRTKDGCGNYGEFTDCRLFTVTAQPLAAPELLSPADGTPSHPTSGILDWSDVEGAVAYRLKLGTACGSGQNHVITAPESQYQFSNLPAGVTHYWQVQTKDSCNQWGPYSECFSFTTHSPSSFVVRPDGSGDYPTIQAAIDAAGPGAIIELTDGTFQGSGNRDLDYHGKAITIRSQSGDPTSCIIEAGGSATDQHRGFYFHTGETSSSVLEGVTVRHGYIGRGGAAYFESGTSPKIRNCRFELSRATESGGGIFCAASSYPDFFDCIFYGNQANVDGGGVYLGSGCSPMLSGCTIQLNLSEFDGGGLFLWGASPVLQGTRVVGNQAHDDGGGVAMRQGANLTLMNSAIVLNSAADDGGGVYGYEGMYAIFENTTIAENSAPAGGGLSLQNGTTAILNSVIVAFSTNGAAIDCSGGSTASLDCCDVYGNAGGDYVGCLSGQNGVNGNISVDPLFCLPAIQDYALHRDSPCAAENNPECSQIGAYGIGCGPTEPQTVLIRPDGTGDYPTIGAALDELPWYSVIELADGVFTGPGNRDLDFTAKRIAIRSQSGNAEACVIDCEGSATDPHRAFHLHTNESDQAIIENVTIRNGYVNDAGGAMLLENGASPTITGCIFENNVSNGVGGAIFCEWTASPDITDCVFTGNFSGNWGGAIDIWHNSEPVLTGCQFLGNVSQFGGAIDVYLGSSVVISGCTFARNEADDGGAIYCEEATCSVLESTFYGNASPPQRLLDRPAPSDLSGIQGGPARPRPSGGRSETAAGVHAAANAVVNLGHSIIAASPVGAAVSCVESAEATLLCCDLNGNAAGDWVGCIAGQENQNGNLSADPMICDPESGDFGLQAESPCAPENNQECGLIGAWEVSCGYDHVVRADGTGDYPTIQDALDGVGDNDVILLADGVYSGNGNRDLDFNGRSLTIRSESGNPELCVIDCQGSLTQQHRGFNFHSGEGPSAVVQGVTIRNGSMWDGGAIACKTVASSPTIRECILEGNTATYGGAIHCTAGSAPTIIDCVIHDNTAEYGGGVQTWLASPSLHGCTITDNTATVSGGGMYCGSSSLPQVLNSILSFSTDGEGIACDASSDVTIACTDIFGNEGGDWIGVIADQLGVNGNIESDPLYCDRGARNYDLHGDSPCAQENSGGCGLIGARGVTCISTGLGGSGALPVHLSLEPNAPNPFVRGTRLTYKVPAAAAGISLILEIYDPAGRIVRRLVSEAAVPGVHSVLWNGQDGLGQPLSSGVYFARLRIPGKAETRKLVMTR